VHNSKLLTLEEMQDLIFQLHNQNLELCIHFGLRNP